MTDRYEIFNPDTFQPYGATASSTEARLFARSEVRGPWVVIDAEYGFTVARGVGAEETGTSAEPLGDYSHAREHLTEVHHIAPLFIIDAGDPDYHGLIAWHNQLHAELDSLASVD